MRSLHLRICLIALISSGACFAGLGIITGDEWGVWEKDGLAVVVAAFKEVTEIKVNADPDNWSDGTHRCVIVPQATLAGTFDASLHPELDVPIWVLATGSTIHEPPIPGTQAIIVIIPYLDGYAIEAKICTFMPGDHAAVAMVKGLDDPRVAATLERIREARKHRKPSPYGRSTTQPSDHSATEPTTQPRD